MITAIVLITAERGSVPTLGEQLADVPGVSEVYSVTGENVDLIAIVRVRKHEDLADIVSKRIAAMPGVAHTNTHVAFKMYSRHDVEAMFGLGAEPRSS